MENKNLCKCIHHSDCNDFVVQYHNLIVHITRKICGKGPHTNEDIEDRVQDVYEKLFENNMKRLRKYDPDRGVKFTSWFSVVVSRIILSHFRKKANLLDQNGIRVFLEHLENESGLPENEMTPESLIIFFQIIDKLSGNEAEVIRLTLLGKSGREIALAMNTTEGNVRVIKTRAIQRMGKMMGNLSDAKAEKV